MGVRIVHNGQARDLVNRHPAPKPHTEWKRKQFPINHRGKTLANLSFFGLTVLQIQRDLDAVVQHFGVNKSDAWKIAIHLTANAVRKNRARVEIDRE